MLDRLIQEGMRSMRRLLLAGTRPLRLLLAATRYRPCTCTVRRLLYKSQYSLSVTAAMANTPHLQHLSRQTTLTLAAETRQYFTLTAWTSALAGAAHARCDWEKQS